MSIVPLLDAIYDGFGEKEEDSKRFKMFMSVLCIYQEVEVCYYHHQCLVTAIQ